LRVLGIDPGTATTGYGVVESRGSELYAIEFGVVRTKSNIPFAERLVRIYGELSEIIERTRPDAVSIEKLFFNTNVSSAMSVGQARGVAVLAAAHAGLEVSEFGPLQVKEAVVGYGKAEKSQVQEMVRMLLCLDDIPKPDDAADGLAIAICRLHMRDPVAAADDS
jgi:crossover junction endodeoxyribonuclease RuvC